MSNEPLKCGSCKYCPGKCMVIAKLCKNKRVRRKVTDLDNIDECEMYFSVLPLTEDTKEEVIFDEQKRLTPINFEGIIGHEDLKEEILLAVLGKLSDNEEYKAYLKSINYHATEGILIYGLPGLGKSDILRAVGESVKGHPDIDCQYMSCSDFQGNVGDNAKKIDTVFNKARTTKKKCCIMLIDEIDSVMMKKRGHLNVAERTNAMQSNMDGIKDSSKIIVIATTNRINGMEEASLSRFTMITLQLPTLNERIELIKKYIAPLYTHEKIDIEIIANQTDGFTGRMFRDIGIKLNKVRSKNGKNGTLTAIDLLKELTKYMNVASKNTHRLTENEDENDSSNCLNRIPYSFNNVTYNKSTKCTLDSEEVKPQSVDSLDLLQQFMQDNYSHMKNPDTKEEMSYRTWKAIKNIQERFKFTEEKAAYIWQDYCKVRGWVST